MCLLVACSLLSAPTVHAADRLGGPQWYGEGAEGEPTVNLYFFWTRTCPHCARARPFVDQLASAYPWLRIHSHQLQGSRENINLYVRLAELLGREARSVPAFIFCREMHTGYDSSQSTGVFLAERLEACHRAIRDVEGRGAWGARDYVAPALELPLVGPVDPARLSLPTLTLVLAAMDAFNPCAFFVLLFLLSLLVHARSRMRVLLIGGTFVLCSGLLYFVFMAAWLNAFLLMGELEVVTRIAGALAVLLAAINIKDYFWFRKGVSLSIPDNAKPGLFARMRRLTASGSLPALLMGTLALAAAANTYELLCTAGFPMVYTRILTLNELPGLAYYLYLAAYNVVYVIPLALIVVVFTLTLGSRKMRESEGRTLKLLSGLMMLGLGALLITAPQLLASVAVATALLAVAVAATVLIVAAERILLRRPKHPRDLSHTPRSGHNTRVGREYTQMDE